MHPESHTPAVAPPAAAQRRGLPGSHFFFDDLLLRLAAQRLGDVVEQGLGLNFLLNAFW